MSQGGKDRSNVRMLRGEAGKGIAAGLFAPADIVAELGKVIALRSLPRRGRGIFGFGISPHAFPIRSADSAAFHLLALCRYSVSLAMSGQRTPNQSVS